jgi:type IV pilus assembly protein PilB
VARRKLGEILIQAGVLDESSLRAALAEQKRWGGHLGRVLIDMHLVSEDVLVQALSQQLNFPVVNLDHRGIAADVLELVQPDMAEQYGLIPYHKEGKFLDVAMVDPTNLGIVDELRIRTQLNVRPYLIGPKAAERAIAKFYGRGTASFAGHAYDPRFLNSPAMPANMQVVELDRGKGPAPTLDSRSSPQLAPPPQPSLAPQVNLRTAEQAAEVRALQERISRLEALVARDEEVLRKLLGLLVEKGMATRDEILERLK